MADTVSLWEPGAIVEEVRRIRLLLDVDRSKHIDDTLGHEGGDGLNITMADRRSAIVRKYDVAARGGGDEFLLMIQSTDKLRLRVVAEGVETEDQRDFLHRHGCSEMQGFLFSEPLTADSFFDFLQETLRAGQYGC